MKITACYRIKFSSVFTGRLAAVAALDAWHSCLSDVTISDDLWRSDFISPRSLLLQSKSVRHTFITQYWIVVKGSLLTLVSWQSLTHKSIALHNTGQIKWLIYCDWYSSLHEWIKILIIVTCVWNMSHNLPYTAHCCICYFPSPHWSNNTYVQAQMVQDWDRTHSSDYDKYMHTANLLFWQY